jgi:predicted PurR-regulated permease PerM
MIFQVPHALAFGFLAAVFELIPVFGPIISAIPAVLSAFAENGLPLGLTVIGVFLLIQQFENHLFYPLVVKKLVGIPPLVVILALIAGWQLAGFWGVILSIPVGVVLMEYFNDLQRERLAEENSKS